jgi:hypothetical protein
MNIIELDDLIDWAYEEVYKDNTWQCRQVVVAELYEALKTINCKEYGRSFSSKFKVDKFARLYCFSHSTSSVLYLPFYTALVKY